MTSQKIIKQIKEDKGKLILMHQIYNYMQQFEINLLI